jgi:hypothetical protein
MKVFSKSLIWKFPITYLLILGIVFFLDVRVFGRKEAAFWNEFYWEKAIVLIFCTFIGVLVAEFIRLKKQGKETPKPN